MLYPSRPMYEHVLFVGIGWSQLNFVDQFRTEPEPKLIALQKKDKKKELLTVDEFKHFSIITSN